MNDAPIGVKTGGGARPQATRMPEDPTRQALGSLSGFMKLAQATAAPALEKARDGEFLRGMMEVQAGRTAEQVAAEQPEWARAFGDPAAVRGAQAQEATAWGARFITGVQANLDELRKLPPDQVTVRMNEALQQSLPTDPTAAALAKQRALQAMPDLMSQYTRAHIAWKQEKAVQDYSASLESEAQLLKVTMERYRQNPAETLDTLPAIDRFLQAAAPPEGMNPDTHRKLLEHTVAGMVGAGGFGAYRALREVGFIDQLSQKAQDQVTTQAYQAAAQAVKASGKQLLPLSEKWANIYAEAWKHDEGWLAEQADGLNAEAEKTLGIPQDFFRFISDQQVEGAQHRRANKLASEEAKEAARKAAEEQRRTRAAITAAEKRREEADKRAQADLLQAVIGSALELAGPGEAGARLAAAGIPRAAVRELENRKWQELDPSKAQPGTPEYAERVQGAAQFLYRYSGGAGSKPIPRDFHNKLFRGLTSTTFGRDTQDAVAILSQVEQMPNGSYLLGRLDLGEQAHAVRIFRQLATAASASAKPADPAELWARARTEALLPRPPGGALGTQAARLQKDLGITHPAAQGIIASTIKSLDSLAGDELVQGVRGALEGKLYQAGKNTVFLERGANTDITQGFGRVVLTVSNQAKALDEYVKHAKKLTKAQGDPVIVRLPNVMVKDPEARGGQRQQAQFLLQFNTPTGIHTTTVTGDKLLDVARWASGDRTGAPMSPDGDPRAPVTPPWYD